MLHKIYRGFPLKYLVGLKTKGRVINITINKNLIFRRWITNGIIKPDRDGIPMIRAEYAINYYIKFFKYEFRKYLKK